VLLGTCVSLAGLSAIGLPARGEEPRPQQLAQTQPRTFNIPAQPLESALLAFGQQSGRQIVSHGDLVRGLSSPGVQGTMSVEAALQQLLTGTGLTYSLSGAAISLQKPGQGAGALQLDPVQVQGNTVPQQAEIGNLPPPFAGGDVARGGRVGELGNRDYMNTPFSTTSYTEKYIERNQARTLIDAVADDPSIRAAFGQGQYNDNLQIRGFFLNTANMSFNGLYGVTPIYAMDLAGIERIEVFRGPSAMLSGMAPQGAIGGTINFVPKRATVAPIMQFTARYASNAQFGGNIDFGRRFGPDDSMGLRLNAAFMSGDTSVSNSADTLLNLTAGFDFKGERTRIDADLAYNNRNITGAQGSTGLAAGLLLPPAPSAQNNYYQPWDFFATNQTYGMLRFEHDLTEEITAFVKVGGRRSNGAFLNYFPTIVNTSGGTSTSASRSLVFNEAVSADAGVRARFATGGLKHEAVVNGSLLTTWSGTRSNAFPGALVSNIYAPVTLPAPNLYPLPTGVPTTSQQVLKNVGVIDAISALDEKIQVIGGVRYQVVQASSWNATTGLQTPGYDQSAVTPSVSAIVRPWKEVSFYGNFIQALEQGVIAPAGLVNAGQVFSPFVSTQFEVGAKVDLGNFGATLSAFQITRPSSYVNAATNSLVVDGQQRNQGIEFTMFGEPVPGFRPIGGFSILNAIQTNTLNGTNNGKYAVGVPTFQANLGFDWETPWVKGLAVGGRVVYTGSTFLDAANLQPVPAWTRVDLSASYTFERADGKPISLRGQVINVGNNNYWMAASGLTQGQPRTFMLSLTADF
jgi:iron complex outermembrane receptor protein